MFLAEKLIDINEQILDAENHIEIETKEARLYHGGDINHHAVKRRLWQITRDKLLKQKMDILNEFGLYPNTNDR